MNILSYERITERIVSLLEQGTVPWHKPWTVKTGLPTESHQQKAVSRHQCIPAHGHELRIAPLAHIPPGNTAWRQRQEGREVLSRRLLETDEE